MSIQASVHRVQPSDRILSPQAARIARRAADPRKEFSLPEREAVYRAIFERRDVRRNFLRTPIPDQVLARLLNAAHHAGSVGFMQPWDFVVIRKAATKRKVKALFHAVNGKAATRYKGARSDLYRSLKLEGIEEAPVNIGVTCSRQRGGRHVLGRSTVRDTDLYSTCCAIQNLWLAARAEGIGVGWVSILDHGALKLVLGIPRPVKVLAYLCLGYVSDFATEPDLETAGWRARIPVDQLIHYESWGKKLQGDRRTGDAHHEGVHENGRRGKNPAGRRAAGVEGQSSS
jgi:5,6-dimethylbenzimidazole synthase